MSTANVVFTPSTDSRVTRYVVVFTVNGVAQTVFVPAAGPYSASVSVSPNDVVSATAYALDATDNLQSIVVASVPASITVPPAPLAPPSNVALSLS